MRSLGIAPLRPKKSLGQNFLRDENISRKIVAAIQPGGDDVMVEIGPGEGALTKYLTSAVAHLVVVDVDDRVVKLMKEMYGNGGPEILHEDVLTTDLGDIVRRYGQPIRIVGNIPYNITSPILFHVLDHRKHVRDAHLMMQKEVARRLVATPHKKDYGILSVVSQLYADVKVLFDVSRNAFFPKPGVTSSVVRLTLLHSPRYPVADETFFRSMVRSIFGKRRKTLRNSLKYFLDDLPTLPAWVDLQKRPEDLSVEQLVALSNNLR